MAPLLEVLNVSKFFGGLCALRDVSLKVYEGDIYGVIGTNGSGKTTLFNLISGVFKPERGKIIFDKKDITRLSAHKIARLGIGRVYQIPRLFWNMSVIENVMVAARHGACMSGSEAAKLVFQILEYVGLGEKVHARCEELLFFELKKLELARALALKPKLLLLDELAAGLDEDALKKLLRIIKEINSDGVTIILIEHDMKVIVNTVNKLMVLHKGEQIAEGSPLQVLESKTVSDIYLGG